MLLDDESNGYPYTIEVVSISLIIFKHLVIQHDCSFQENYTISIQISQNMYSDMD